MREGEEHIINLKEKTNNKPGGTPPGPEPVENKLDAQPPEKPIEEGKAPDIKPVPESPPAEINKETPVEQAETKKDLTLEDAIKKLEDEIGEKIKEGHREALEKTFELTGDFESMRKNLDRMREADPSKKIDYGRPEEAEAETEVAPPMVEKAEELSVVDANSIEKLIDNTSLAIELKKINPDITPDQINSVIDKAKDKLPDLFNKNKTVKRNTENVHASIIQAVKKKPQLGLKEAG